MGEERKSNDGLLEAGELGEERCFLREFLACLQSRRIFLLGII